MKTQEIIKQVNEAIKKVFRTIPVGFEEKIYQKALCYELEKRNIKFYEEESQPSIYEGKFLCSFRPDLFIPTKDGDYILELKHKTDIEDRDKINSWFFGQFWQKRCSRL
jgi:GxxExxY protein